MKTDKTVLEQAIFHADRLTKKAKGDNPQLHALMVRHHAALMQMYAEQLATEAGRLS